MSIKNSAKNVKHDMFHLLEEIVNYLRMTSTPSSSFTGKNVKVKEKSKYLVIRPQTVILPVCKC